MNEEWKPVVGYEDLYRVSSKGRVFSLLTGRFLKPYILFEYAIVRLYKDKQPKALRIHRLVLEAFVGPCPEGMETRHWNDIKLDNNLENLSWGTPLENAADRVRNGWDNKGEKHGMAVLNENIVRFIRKQRWPNPNFSQKDLADLLGIAQSVVCRVRLGQLWSHVK